MSSILRMLKLQKFIKTYSGINVRGLYNGLNQRVSISKFNPVKIASASINVRTYAVQYPTLDSSISLRKRNFTLYDELEHLDSLLQRGAFIKKNTMEMVLKKLIAADDVTPSQALFLLRCCGSASSLERKETRSKLASKIWNAYQEKGLALDISHYNALLHVFLENETEFSPLDFLATLEEKQIEPNRITYSRLIHKFCQKGDIEGANKILEFMKAKGMELNEYIFNVLILGNSRANDLPGAVGILEIMKQSDLSPSADTYAVLVQAYAEHKKIEEIEKLVEEIGSDVNFQERALMNVICTLADKDLSSLAEKIFSNLKNDKGYPLRVVKSTIGRLIFGGHDDLAFSLFKTLNFNKDIHHQWSFFPKQLASSDMDLYKVVNYCEEIRNNGWNILAFENALESYIVDGNFDKALGILRVMKEKNITIKEHYFYPIIADYARRDDKEKIYDLLEEVMRLQVPLSTKFYSHFLLPSLKISDDMKDLEEIFSRLCNYQGEVNRITYYSGIVEYLLREYSLESAAKFVSQNRYGLYYNLATFIGDSFLKSLNVKAAAMLVRQILPLNIRLNKDLDIESLEGQYYGVKSFFRKVVGGLQKRQLQDNYLLPLLKAMLDEGIYIVPSVVEFIRAEIGESVTAEIEEALQNLSDFDLFQSIVPRENSSSMPRMNLRKRIEESETDGEFNEELNMALAVSLIRQRNLKELQGLLEKMQRNEVTLPIPVKLMLMEFYINEKMFKEAEDILNEIHDESQDVQMDAKKIMYVARMFVEQGRYDDAVKCLLIHSPEDGRWLKDFEPNFDNGSYKAKIVNMMRDVVNHSDLATLKRLQETLLSRRFAQPSWVLPSLVQFHLKEDNLEEAFSCFEKIAEEHNITASKRDLTVSCINKEDSDKMEKIVDISNRIHGDMNTLYDIAFAFIEVGRLKQAEKVLMTTGLRSLQNKLDGQCEIYLRFNRIEHLEGLVTVTKRLFDVDRQKLYNYLLNGYIEADDPDKALGIWNRMQEEDVDPDSKFLLTLSKFLVSKDLQVPFVVPSSSSQDQQSLSTQNTSRRISKQSSSLSTVDKIILALDESRSDYAEDLYKREKALGTEFPTKLISRMIGLQLSKGNFSEALEETKLMMLKNNFPPVSAMRKLLDELVKRGDVAAIEHLGQYMDKEYKRRCFYETMLCSSQIEAGRAEEVMQKSMKVIDEASSFNDVTFDVITPRAYRRALKKHPELHPQLEQFAEKVKAKGNDIFYHCIYHHNFMTGNKEIAEKIYDTHLKDLDSFYIRGICLECFTGKNVDKLQELLQVLNQKPEGRDQMKGIAYSTYINILMKENKLDEALNVITKSLESIKIEDYDSEKLIQLKKKCLKQQLSFPFSIPNREQTRRSQSSSSSSSDDEK